MLAIAWGTLSIVLLLSFGEGLKRAFHRGPGHGGGDRCRVARGYRDAAYMGLASGRTLSFTG